MNRFVSIVVVVTGISLSALALKSLAAPPGEARPDNGRRQRWEYKVIDETAFLVNAEKPDGSEKLTLHQYGDLGWELTAIEPSNSRYPASRYYFKRPKQR